MVTRPKLRLSRYLVPVIIVLAIIFLSANAVIRKSRQDTRVIMQPLPKKVYCVIATEYNSISFYVDGDTISGFHYELIQALPMTRD